MTLFIVWFALAGVALLILRFWSYHDEAHFKSIGAALEETADRVHKDIEEWFSTNDDDRDGELSRLIKSRWAAYDMFNETRAPLFCRSKK